MLELKLNKETMFEWQKAGQDSRKIPHHDDLLRFLDLQAQASETCASEPKRHNPLGKPSPKSATAFMANTAESIPNSSLCKTQRHPLYICPQFMLLPHSEMLSTVHSSNASLNCLKPGHFTRNCASNNWCWKCQGQHHTLLHSDSLKYPPRKQTAVI